MPIQNSKQNWNVGDTVKVGFMKGLKVLRLIPTPGDYAPDEYLLQNQSGSLYSFVPHKGLTKVEAWMDGGRYAA